MSRPIVKTRVLADKVERYTIWDNFERHVGELRDRGATEADIELLRKAAAEVDVFERQADIDAGRNPELEHSDLGAMTAPRTCANGWVIQPPTAMARRWAMIASVRLTKGTPPEDPLISAMVVLVSLWVLMMWGNGKKDLVMQVLLAAGRLAELVPELMESFEAGGFEALLDDYLALMGIAEKKTPSPARQQYETLLQEIRTRSSAASTAGC